MSLKEFDKNDIFKNVIKTKPYYNIKIYGNNININNSPDGYIKINSLNIPNISDYYSFAFKNSSGDGLSNVNQDSYSTSLYGQQQKLQYPLSSSIQINYLPASSGFINSRARIYALRNTLERYTKYSQNFSYNSPLGNKENQEMVLISIPSSFYGSSINPGSVELTSYFSGTVFARLNDIKLNGELIETTGSNSGSVAGVVLYNEGFVILTGSWLEPYVPIIPKLDFRTLSGGLGGTVYSVFSGSDGIYVGGSFTTTGNNISRWNGTSWSALAGGLGGVVYSVFSGSDGVYAGGAFTTTGNRVSRWNGTSWSTLAGGLGGTVRSIFSSSDGVYAGGSFTTIGNNISRWNGTSWNALAGGLGGEVLSIFSGSDGIYAGGNFTGASGNCISRWDGTSWNPLAGGLNAAVNSFFSGSDGIYAVGNFSVTGNRVSRWNGTSWNALAGGFDRSVFSVLSSSDGVYVGGNFSGSSGNYISRWNGTSWNPLSGGLNNNVRSILSSSDGIYVGGDFTGDSGSRISIWKNYYEPSSINLKTWQEFGQSITNNISNYYINISSSYSLSFKGVNYIPTLTMMAHAKKNEFNFSNNPTYIKYGQTSKYVTASSNNYIEPDNIEIKNTKKYPYSNFSGSLEKQTFITKIGIYDENKRLIAVAKLASPIKKTESRDITFKLKLDI